MPEAATTAAAACRCTTLACSPQVQLSQYAVSSIIVDVCLSLLLHSDAMHIARALPLLLLLLVVVVVLQLVLLLLVVAVQ
jgi:hypothetical protein